LLQYGLILRTEGVVHILLRVHTLLILLIARVLPCVVLLFLFLLLLGVLLRRLRSFLRFGLVHVVVRMRGRIFLLGRLRWFLGRLAIRFVSGRFRVGFLRLRFLRRLGGLVGRLLRWFFVLHREGKQRRRDGQTCVSESRRGSKRASHGECDYR